MKEPIAVKVGQLWVDCDKRMNGRTLRVVELFEHTRNGQLERYARCRVGAGPELYTRIRIDRFRPTSTGFRLVRDENGNRVEQLETEAK